MGDEGEPEGGAYRLGARVVERRRIEEQAAVVRARARKVL
jgi:hypothetical protein